MLWRTSSLCSLTSGAGNCTFHLTHILFSVLSAFAPALNYFASPGDVLTSRVWTAGPGHFEPVCLISRPLTAPAALWSDTTVFMMTWGCLHWTGEAGCWHTLTTICLQSDVSEANTIGLVSKTIHKRDGVAPYLGIMLDILCVSVIVLADICF